MADTKTGYCPQCGQFAYGQENPPGSGYYQMFCSKCCYSWFEGAFKRIRQWLREK